MLSSSLRLLFTLDDGYPRSLRPKPQLLKRAAHDGAALPNQGKAYQRRARHVNQNHGQGPEKATV